MVEERLPFFDFSKAKGPRQGPDVGVDGAADAVGPPGEAPLSVTQLVAMIKDALSDSLPKRLIVAAQISNVKLHSSGHIYFRLKDANSAIDAAMFRSAAQRLKFQPTDGMDVLVEGRVDVYDPRGQLQFYVEQITPRGVGALELAFRQLQEKLRAEGLFDPSHKVPIVRFPRAIGVITSPTGAVIRDIRRTLLRRWPAAAVYLLPTPVQGEGAAESIARAIVLMDANARRFEIDTIIVARGGGSLEDLWAFNEEAVARAIFAADTPIISGVGHEVDVTICDMVADVRAATPTAAAELAVPDRVEVRRHILQLEARAARHLTHSLRSGRSELKAILSSATFRDPLGRIRTQMQRTDELAHRLRAGAREMIASDKSRLGAAVNGLAACHPGRILEKARGKMNNAMARLAWVLGGASKRAGDALARMETRLQAVHPRNSLKLAVQKVDAMARQFESMSYRSVLCRGFSVTRGAGGRTIRSVADVTSGELIRTELADGKISSKVLNGAAPGRKSPKAPQDSPGGLFDQPAQE